MDVSPAALAHGLVRSSLLRVSDNRAARTRITRSAIVRRMASRFMPGERLEDALHAAKPLAAHGTSSLVTLLGEDVADPEDAHATTRHYLDALEQIASRDLPTHLSVKPTQLGMGLRDSSLLVSNLEQLAESSARHGRLLWMDMEGSAWTDATLDAFRELRPRHENVGLCLQAYMRRTPSDLMSLLPLRPRIRLVKGAYQESNAIALHSPHEISGAFRQLALKLIEEAPNGMPPPTLGTHDLDLVESIVTQSPHGKDDFEVAMLYGIRSDELRRLQRDGYRTSVLISYGSEWAAWYMRRLAERPANLAFGVTALVRR